MHGTLTSKTNEIRSKTRVKFGVFWVVLTFLTCGLTFFVWLMMPRENRLLSVDRYNECSNCKVRQ